VTSLAIRNATVVRPFGRSPSTILIDDGRVQALLAPSERPAAETTIDARGAYVIPGVIDPHVHLGLSQTFADACRNESRAAVTGGVTTMLHYLLSPGSFLDAYGDHATAVEAHSLVDVGFHALITNDAQVAEIPRTVDELRLTSYKFHMAMKGPEAAYGIRGVDDGALLEGLRNVASRPGVLALVHAENIDVILRGRDRMMARHGDETRTAIWSEYRPAFTEEEEEAITRAFRLADEAGSPVGIVHTSVGRGPELLARARVHYPHLYMETCPQYLVLDQDMDLGTWGKVNPPLRTRADQELLWQALATGGIDWLGSDLCDYDRASREGSLWEVGPGLPSGMTLILPVLLSHGVRRGCLTLEQVVALTSTNFARLGGFAPRKGALEVGSDADLVILDLDHEVTISAEILNSHSDYTPYEGMVLTGWARTTVAGGEVRYDRGDVADGGRRGRVLRQDPEQVPAL